MKLKTAFAALTALLTCFAQTPVFAAEEDSVNTIQEKGIAGAPESITEESRAVIVGSEPAGSLVQESSVGMFRLYNPNSGEHFYTADTNEKNYLVSVGWTSEGIGWTAPMLSDTPVYRLYNENEGDHHYSRSQKEVDYLKQAGWKDEGIGWYSAPEEGTAIYRQYNPNAKSGSHNYTMDTNEDENLGKAGWNREGIGWYGLNTACPAVNVISDLEEQMKAMNTELKENAVSDMRFGSLREKGEQIEAVLNSMHRQFPNRYFVFQKGHLAGWSDEKSDTVSLPNIEAGSSILLIQPGQKKAQLAQKISDGALADETFSFGVGLDTSDFRAVSGSLKNGVYQDQTFCYDLVRDGDSLSEEMSGGQAIDNLMNGRIEKHTHHFSGTNTNISDYRWYLTMTNGNASYLTDGSLYIVYLTDQLKVYYDYEPKGLRFWAEDWLLR